MRILAIDTTSAFGSIALWQDEAVEEIPIHSPEGFAQVLFGHVERLLRRHDWGISSIDCFASAAGPGSFTGVRVGLACVKGLAEAMNRPAVAVSNLMALAHFGSTGLRAVVMDARRGEVYGAVYDAELQIVQPESVAPFPRWLRDLPVGITELISPDFTPFRGSFPLDVPVTEQRVLARAVAAIAADRVRTGLAADPAGTDANYVRRSDAELFWRDKA
jgi:tRNA threonylcarbamoyladenosine biosynthesis protein TsaB